MSEVARYELRIVSRYSADGEGDIETDASMRPSPRGLWVRYEDVHHLLDDAPPASAGADRRVEAMAAKLYPLLNQWKPTTSKAMEAKSTVAVVLREALAKGEAAE